MINENELNIDNGENNDKSLTDDVIKTTIDESKVEEIINDEEKNKNFDYLSNEVLDLKNYSIEEATDLLKKSKRNQELDEDLYNDELSNIQEKQVIKGTVVGNNDKGVIIDIGFKSEGVIDRNEFKKIPEIGEEVDVFLITFENRKGQMLLSKEKADFTKRWDELRNAFSDETIIKGNILKRIKGGFVVDLGVVNAFLPGSQIDVKSVTDYDQYIGNEYEFKIVKFNEFRQNIVVSRKAILAGDVDEQKKKILEKIEVGAVYEGTVKNITDFGAFIDLGGIDGLLHITDITWGRINHPSDKISLGEKVEVKVIDFNVKDIKISLGMKQLQEEPWKKVDDKYSVGSKIEGKVVNLMNYGLFLQLEEGIEGLIHISEMSWTKHIKHPSDIYQINDIIEATVISLDKEKKKIALGIKQLLENPWETIETKYPAESVHKGIVKHFTQYGAFIELEEGIDGLLHISDISWTNIIKHPKDTLNIGDEIKVKILEVSSEERKLGVGLKQLEEDPLVKYNIGDRVQAKLIRISDKGLIFEVNNSIEGILYFNDIDSEEKEKIQNEYSVDENYDMLISEVNLSIKKIIFISKDDSKAE